MDAQRAPVDQAARTDLRELVRAVPAVLPVAVELPERAVRPQPPRLHPPGALRLRGVPTTSTRSPRCCRGRATRRRLVGKYLNGYGEQYLRSDKSSLHYVPPGWDQWYAGSDHLWDFDDPNYGGGHVLLQQAGPEHQRDDPLLPRALLHRRARRAGTRRDRRVRARRGRRGSCGGRRPHLTTDSRESPTTRRPRGGGTASSASGTPPDVRTGSRAGSTSQITHGAGTPRRARPRRTPATSRTTCASCPSSRRPRRTRRRA